MDEGGGKFRKNTMIRCTSLLCRGGREFIITTLQEDGPLADLRTSVGGADPAAGGLPGGRGHHDNRRLLEGPVPFPQNHSDALGVESPGGVVCVTVLPGGLCRLFRHPLDPFYYGACFPLPWAPPSPVRADVKASLPPCRPFVPSGGHRQERRVL